MNYQFINIIFGILIIYVLYIVLCNTHQSTIDGFTNKTDIIPDLEQGQSRFNKFMNLVNLTNPAIQLNSSGNIINQAISTPIYNKTDKSGSFAKSGTKTYKTLATQPPSLVAAQKCEQIKTTTCDSFSNPQFSANCGISFDKNGIDSTGKPHMGGMYISPDDKEAQSISGGGNGIFQPTIGISKKGMFAADATSCTTIQQEIECKSKHSFNVPNCGQCMTSGQWHRVDPNTPMVSPVITLQGTATTVTIQTPSAGSVSVPTISSSTPSQVSIPSPGLNEGDIFIIDVSGIPGNCFISGYITGQTARGPFNMDINALIDVDLTTNYKPRISGTQDIGNIRCMVLMPSNGSGSMSLRAHLPFSFVSTTESDATNCDNGPFITQASSASFLSSDICYGPTSTPGNYSLACLQQMFIQLGGMTTGGGYPTDTTSAASLLLDASGNAQTMDQISDYLNTMNIQASTGRDAGGNTLSMDDWNTSSMFCTGTPIITPCGSGNPSEIPSQDCMIFLYQNQGSGNSVGPTYTLPPSQYASLDNTLQQTFCRPEGTLNPVNSAGLAAAQSAGTIAGVKSLYDTVHKSANDNTLTNVQRSQAIQQCYGSTLVPTHQPEPYLVSGGVYGSGSAMYTIPQSQASAVCQQFGASIATTEQVTQAQQQYGADWCSAGWVGDNQSAIYPITTSISLATCDASAPGIQMSSGLSNAGTTCYGIKPAPGTIQNNLYIMPFNRTSWYMDQNDINSPVIASTS